MNKFEREGYHPVAFNPDDGCNVSDDLILHQVRENIRRKLPQVMPYAKNPNTVALVCGGPSLEMYKDDLIEAAAEGAKVVALNGAYQWCIDNGIRVSAMVMLDARQFNSRFVEQPVDGCRYLLASQCHPDAFELCKDRDVTIFHCCSSGEDEHMMLREFYFNRLFPIPIGTTVAIKGLQVLNMIGFKRFDCFGFDSCWMGDKHHSYSQPENDRDKYMPVWITPPEDHSLAEKFWCAPWMMRQAVDFQKLVHDCGDDYEICVRGEGLIAATLRLAAQSVGMPTIEE